jgi:polyphosphate glucokinase
MYDWQMKTPKGPLTLAIDIGGTGLKMMVLDANATPVTERTKVPTPRPAKPKAIIDALMQMIKSHGSFDRISVGFPGVVQKGVVKTAPNLDKSWEGVDLQKKLKSLTKKPTQVANDADVQGYGDIKGKGVELVITLGTGMGSALFLEGKLVPNLELGHHPLKKDETYEDLLGKAALQKHGTKKWNKNLLHAIDVMSRIFNFDQLFVGGGNAAHVKIKLPENVRLTNNIAGLLGGVKLWNVKP